MAQQRFYSATDKLISAFMTVGVVHGDSCSCAVGRMLPIKCDWFVNFDPDARTPTPEFSIEAIKVGYSAREMLLVEKEFEGRASSQMDKFSPQTLTKHNDRDGFRGLCNVFDYLVSIEDWKEEEKGSDIFELLEAVNN